jgi:hypothetical protein
MPYIKQEDRENEGITNLQTVSQEVGYLCDNGGDMNFAFCTIVDEFIRQKGLRYQNISDIIGALDGAKAEFQRRIVGPYEDQKLAENGEVFHFAAGALDQ